MKTLAKNKNKVINWIVITIVCYLLASQGVNGVISPVHYFTHCEKVTVDVAQTETHLIITLTQSQEEQGYLNICAAKMDKFKENVTFDTGTSEVKSKIKLPISEGINPLPIEKLEMKGDTIAISKEELVKLNVEIVEIYWSEQKHMDIVQMILVFCSFLGMAVFYAAIKMIKVRYAK